MNHLGDITKIDGAAVEPVEVVIGGSPCQDLSVAGKREGLSGERSGLFMEQIRIIKEMRRKDIESGAVNPRPRYMVWENVPGAFSSNKGEDFRIVLEETARICNPTAVIPRPEGGRWTNSGTVMGAGWSIAWRVHDAQFWGVPQRRRRIALVADFGGYTAPEILFERESVSRDSEESGTERKATAADSDECPRATNRMYDVTRRHEYTSECKVAPTVTALYGTGGGNTPVIVNDKSVLCVRERCGCDGGGKGLLIQKDKSGTLAVSNDQMVVYGFPLGFRSENVRTYQEKPSTVCNGSRPGFCNGVVTIDRAAFNQGINARYDMEISENGINSTLTARGPSAVCAAFEYNQGAKARTIAYQEEQSPCLSSEQHDVSVVTISAVRRLTPLECERLQGFPDGWTDIGEWTDSKGKKRKTSDTARYKALGNSIALPFWAWMLARLNGYCEEHTMASLFDGIGGFPLIWETLNSKGSCLWASEIEEFPIAVTKYHFGG